MSITVHHDNTNSKTNWHGISLKNRLSGRTSFRALSMARQKTHYGEKSANKEEIKETVLKWLWEKQKKFLPTELVSFYIDRTSTKMLGVIAMKNATHSTNRIHFWSYSDLSFTYLITLVYLKYFRITVGKLNI